MELFEAILALLVVAVVLLQLSRRLMLPYPALLALAGGLVAGIPWTPTLVIEPHLALALFIAPALLDAAFDTAPRELKRNWLPLVSLILIAVLLTTAAVAALGVQFAGLPLAAAIALGAIVAPPDAAAGAAVLERFKLPRKTISVLQGESLLNDAVALLIFAGAMSAAGLNGAHSPDAATASDGGAIWALILAVPGGVIVGIVSARLFVFFKPFVAGTLSGTIIEFVATFGVWLIAERLHMSPILAVVAYAMVIATYMPARTRARDRVHSYAVWSAVVFVLNVLAFLFMGLQARIILGRLHGQELWHAFGFAGLVLAVVVAVRLAWVMIYGFIVRHSDWLQKHQAEASPIPDVKTGILVSWCGMRGLVTMATSFALPAQFPGRDLIALSAFVVVLGTLVFQGLTIGPLIKLLKIQPDESFGSEVSSARTAMLDAALASLEDESGSTADVVRSEYQATRKIATDDHDPQAMTDHERLRMKAIGAQRDTLNQLRDRGQIDDDVYHRLEEELDWSELSAASSEDVQIAVT